MSAVLSAVTEAVHAAGMALEALACQAEQFADPDSRADADLRAALVQAQIVIKKARGDR